MATTSKFILGGETALRSMVLAAALAGGVGATAAHAQSDAASSQPAECNDKDTAANCNQNGDAQIVVTGSRISHRETESSSPLQVLDAK